MDTNQDCKDLGEVARSSCGPQNFAPRDKYILIVLFDGFDEIAHFKRFASLEKLQGAAHYWKSVNDSEGTPRYKVLELQNLQYT